uniref:EF-hand domain-containing protein n=1 Tax=Steinernema glaseri TaxID=37863 RepID=A0A1I7ZXL9_9BILA
MNKQLSRVHHCHHEDGGQQSQEEVPGGHEEKKENKEVPIQDTTILIHLFGQKGNNSLGFDQFQLFYNNLQRELMEIEFHEFARGKTEISPMNFARLVLRYSMIHQDDYTTYINRVQDRSCVDDAGVDLEQFEQFSLFLNNLAEFTVAVRLYTAADMPVSRSEFIRAVKCSTGHELDPHLVDILYRIFDANGDGRLSYSEFIAVMNDRLHRGFKSNSKMTAMGWKPFRDCVISEFARF